MTGVPTPPAAHFLGLAGAFLMISASAALGAYYGYMVGAHQHVALGVIFGGAALGGEILKPFAVAGAVDALRSREFLRGLSCIVLALACIVYSLAAELSLAAGSRGDLANARQLSAETVQGVRERRTRAAAELATIVPARPPAELEPLIAKLEATPGANGCVSPANTNAARKACGDVLSLQSEAARAVRRAELAATIAGADTALSERANTPIAAAGTADPLASTLSAYASATGRDWKPDSIAPWLALIPVLFLELGSALALIVVRTVGAGRPAPATPTMADATPAPSARPAPGIQSAPVAPVGNVSGEPPKPAANQPDAASAPVPLNPDKPRRERERDRGDDDRKPSGGSRRRLGVMADAIRAHGGKLQGGQREIAKALGMSKSRVNELLHELAAAGAVRLAIGRHGTMVELATA